MHEKHSAQPIAITGNAQAAQAALRLVVVPSIIHAGLAGVH